LKLTLLAVALLVLVMVGISSASLNLTSDVGETWIKWSWDLNSTVNVYIDGTSEAVNLTSSLYLLSDLNPSEEHDISLYNSTGGELLDSDTATTLPSLPLTVAILIIAIVFAAMIFVVGDVYRAILCGAVSAVFSLYFTTLAYPYYFGYAIGGIILVCFSVTLVILAVLDFKRGDEDD
jgi:hypothetical protein